LPRVRAGEKIILPPSVRAKKTKIIKKKIIIKIPPSVKTGETIAI